MMWQISDLVDLRNDRVSDVDADRQQRTAAEILHRLNDQPGVVLADEVGMGKTYVALAVAVSVLEATQRKRPVVVMVPSGVADKWPMEWAVFAERCLRPGHGLRASPAIRRGSDFLKLLDDPASRRHHLIFITHGALTRNLHDPFIRLALLRRAMLRRRDLVDRRRAVARFAGSLLTDHRFDEATTQALLFAPISQWKRVWERRKPDAPLDDDPVPFSLEKAVGRVDLAPLRDALAAVPLRRSSSSQARSRGRDVNLTWPSTRRGQRAFGRWTSTCRSSFSTKHITSRTRTSSLDCSRTRRQNRMRQPFRVLSATCSSGCCSSPPPPFSLDITSCCAC
jgi:hypothetical protein